MDKCHLPKILVHSFDTARQRERREAMTAARRRGEMVAARVLGAAQIACVCARARLTKVVVPTLDCGLVSRKLEDFLHNV
jgi:hypothetical protein